ncbi:MAG: hypothetical protein SWK90_18660 [Chloroflexota bacterium]|nr:hypothetical protein [Chloroflexota bacterium]
MIEKDFDVPFVAQLARREKQLQQHYRPVIGVHKWFVRRPGTLFSALLLAEFADDQPLANRFFSDHDWCTIHQSNRIVALLHLLVTQVFSGGLDHGDQIAAADFEPIQVDQLDRVTC